MNGTITDPVCGMSVQPERAFSALYNAYTVYFCSELCQRQFLERPEKYFSALDAMGLNPVMAIGKTHVADRGAAVHKFQNDPSTRVFVGSIKAAGVGITLTAACGVDFAEQSPVPGEMSQCEDRAHRIGQKGFVHVRIFVCDKSLSARIMQIVVRKQGVISAGLDTMAGEEPMRKEG